MNDDMVISVKNLVKTYSLYNSHADRVKETFHPFRKKYHHPFNAINDISFELRRGETVGIIGRNGSGKSTLLQIISGIIQPTSGTVTVNGRISTLLELGAGFNPDFTGRQNVFINGAIIGMKNKEIEARFDNITAFAGIGEFIDQPVKTYSTGMYIRLAFAVQVCLDSEILIIDEILSVGDIFFQQKCHERMEEMQSRGTSIIIVSHDMSAIQKYTTQTMLIDQGRCLFLGNPNEAVQRFYQMEWGFRPDTGSVQSDDIAKPNAGISRFNREVISDWPADNAFLDLTKAVVIGATEVANCTGIALINDNGEPNNTFRIGDLACFYFEFELLQDIQVPVGGVTITNELNIPVHGKNSFQYMVKAPPVARKGTRVRFRQRMELAVAPGVYTFTVGFATISADEYAHFTEVEYPQTSFPQLEGILRIRQAGIIVVQGKLRGLSIPFHGYADLKGDCVLSVTN